MTLEKLKKMLEDGAINQKEFDEMVDKLGLSESKDDGKKDDKKDDNGLPENLKKVIQSEVDRATNKLGNENKSLREQLEALKKEKMDDDELKKYELEQKEKELAEKEKEIQQRELKAFASRTIREAGLDDGSELGMALVEVLMGSDEDSITANTKTFKALLDKSVETQVKQRFKDSGRDIGKGGSDDKGDSDNDNNNDVAVRLAKATAENNKTTQSIIDHYTGGKTE